jgi:predicted GNAT family N-acyltransferase
MSGSVVTRFVDADDVRPLRLTVLRAGRPPETTVLEGDDDPLTRHVAALEDGTIVAVGTVIPTAPPWEPRRPGSWRIRGMATLEGARGRGLGGLVLAELIDYAAGADAALLWCAARTPAITFYERFGFASVGERFESEGVEHVHMWRAVRPDPVGGVRTPGKARP